MNSDTVADYLRTFETLRASKRWSDDVAILRFVALTLTAAGLRDPRTSLDEVASILRTQAGWTSPLKSPLRYAVAAMILRRQLDAARTHAQVEKTVAALREQGLPRRGAAPLLAALLLVLHHQGREVPRRDLERMGEIYRRWRDDHFWLTGADDLPAAAIHAMREQPVETLGHEVERAYRKLHDAGFRRGQQLQFVSQILAVDPRGVDASVERFKSCAKALEQGKQRVAPKAYDEIAILALTESDPAALIERVLGYRDRLLALKPKPAKEIALSIATGIALAEDMEKSAGRNVGDLAMARSVQAILDAQQAMMSAAMIATISASTAAAAASH